MAVTGPKQTNGDASAVFGPFQAAIDYWTDTAQRSVLFMDTMRQRGNAFRELAATAAPHALEFDFDLVVDGRKLERPVNYALVQVKPPKGVEVDPARRPFVVVDPRAGHGPGIGGFKADSEIGVAFKAGHPCYFVGFLPDPMPGQTIEDIARAEAVFLKTVIDRHPDADGKPCVIGNCQAGWAIMMLAAIRPELFGPIIVAGSPLSYWAGVHGQNPMRYSGGLLGGSWMTALASDLGCGKFDGAWLVQNFESQNPANTYWSKQYNLYSKIDTEAQRYLGFERWWGGHVNLNAEEIQFIVDELFVGNNLAAGRIRTSDGRSVDLRNIRSPIVVFCSQGDNITPPQQALGWLLDLYDDVNEIRSYGQTIVYSIHETVGHLGIFVSGSVARKEHDEFSSNIDLIDTLPPGLYEAIFEKKSSSVANEDLAGGEWIMRCEARTLDDIRRLGGNDAADQRKFETAAQVSKANLAMYRALVQPWVRAFANPQLAEWMQKCHPLRSQYEAFSDANPLMRPVAALAEQVGSNRKAVAPDNPFLAFQETASRQIVDMFEAWRKATETASERMFHAIYGSPVLQTMMGVDPRAGDDLRRAGKDSLHLRFVDSRIEELRSKIDAGGLREAVIRSVLYIGAARGSVDERGFELIRQIRARRDSNLPLSEFKSLVRQQFFLLLIDENAALEAIPAMLPEDGDERKEALAEMKKLLGARGEPPAEVVKRFERIARYFESDRPAAKVTRIPGGKKPDDQLAS